MCIQGVKALGPEMLGAWYVKKTRASRAKVMTSYFVYLKTTISGLDTLKYL